MSDTQIKPVDSGRQVIITCAVTGSIHTPSMTPWLPITPEQIAEQGIAAAHAGAAILHLHVRDPRDGQPSPSPALFKEVVARILESVDVVINISTGGGHNMTVEQRLEAALALSPEMASLNMGSMNFGLYPALERQRNWKYAWEPQYLENTRDFIFKNTFRDIEVAIQRLYDACGTRFEFECYDIGHLYTLAHFADRGLVKPPFFVQSIFGILGGIGADHENVDHMRRIADKLFGDDYRWSVLAAGRHQMPFVTHAATIGANVRVGLEDSIYLRKGQLAQNNAEQVRLIRSILEGLSYSIADPDTVRQELALKTAKVSA
jgi:Uncharacterized conserved protein